MKTAIMTCVFIVTTILSTDLAAIRVVIDPGHGGQTARKYGNNGDGRGSYGPADSLSEQWVNLHVATTVYALMVYNSPTPSVTLTRSDDTTRVSIPQRVQITKDCAADYFLSVHHNGLDVGIQGTEVWWDSTGLDDSGYARVQEARDSTFAKKVFLRLKVDWNYANRCSSQFQENWMEGCNCYGRDNFYLLHNTRHCPCILSEASNLHNYTEEDLFNRDGIHIASEAGALFHGWHSYHSNMGFGRVSNRYIGGPGQSVGVDGVEWNTPVEFTWEYGEQHELIAWPNFYFNGNTYSFHHWAHLSCNDCFIDSFHTSRYYDVTIPYEFEEHIYRAYFTGGPYYCEVDGVPTPYRYALGDTVQFLWYTSAGVDSTAQVSLYLDRQNGAQGYPELLAENVPWKQRGYLNWVVTGPECAQCRLKVVSNDIAGNTASEVAESWNTFSVCSWKVGDADGSGSYTISDAVRILNYILEGGPPPTPHIVGSGDANCTYNMNISDAVYMINYIVSGGPAPGLTCSCANYE